MMSVQVVMVIGDDDGDVDDHDQADTDADQDLDVDDDNGDGGCTGAVGPEVAVMRFANCARFARCRNSHLSAWSRNLNFQLHRGIASSPLLRVAAEFRPQSGWPEQRLSASYWGLNQASSGSSDEVAIAEEVSAVIQALAEMDALTSWSPGWSGCLDQLVVGFTAGHQIPRRTVEPDQMA
ncbi:unnamed protein product [Symbiodinium sp. KB8]|nr:unnamed protein product [Symbiodinium sp. KB8]